MRFTYFKYLNSLEKAFYFLNIATLLFLAYSIFFRGASFGIDSALLLIAILKSNFALISLGTHRIPMRERDEKIKSQLQQMEKQKWIYGNSLKGPVIWWLIAISWIVFASIVLKTIL